MTHESDILPCSFKVQPWRKLKNVLQTDLLWTHLIPRLNTVYSQFVQVSLIPHLLEALSPPPHPEISHFFVKWSWPTAFDFLHHSGTTLHVWSNCLRCLWIHIWFAIPKGFKSQWMHLYLTRLFDSCKGMSCRRRLCAIHRLSRTKCVAQLLLTSAE